MKILTLNLNGYQETNRYGKLEQIAEEIVTKDIDVICLQEVTQYHLEDHLYEDVKSGNLAYVLQSILERLYDVKYSLDIKMFKTTLKIYDEGVAILTKGELKNVYFSQISNYSITKNDFIRYALFGNYEGNQIVCTHLNPINDLEEYKLQVVRIANNLLFDEKIVLCGTMNIDEEDNEYNDFINENFIDVIKLTNRNLAEQITNLKISKRTDYIFTNFTNVKHSSILFDKNRVSDHVGLLLEI